MQIVYCVQICFDNVAVTATEPERVSSGHPQGLYMCYHIVRVGRKNKYTNYYCSTLTLFSGGVIHYYSYVDHLPNWLFVQ
jgi:hypothetical protein